MLANGADEVIGQFLALILITANDAPPDGLALGIPADRLGVRLDVLLVVIIGGGGNIGERLHFGDNTDKKDMRAQIDNLLHICRKEGVCPASDCQCAVSDATAVGEVRKLIDHTPALETEVFEQFEVGRLADDGGREASRTPDKFGGQVALVQGHGDTVGLRRHLLDGIADAAIVAAAVAGGDDEQAVLDVE